MDSNRDDSGEQPIWNNLKQMRKLLKLTQQELAVATGCTRQEISMMENSRFHGGFHKVERVFRYLGAPLQPRFSAAHAELSPPSASRKLPELPSVIRILAIDDDPEILNGYQRTFEPHRQSGIHSLLEAFQAPQAESAPQPFEIDTATGGEQGYKMVQQALLSDHPYSLLLLDMRMPEGWEGLKTAREIRKIDPDVRIIVLSAYRDYTLSKMREEIGEHFVVQHKPYLQDELLQLTTFMGMEWLQSKARHLQSVSPSEQH